jgi:hypothetical protein
MFIGNFVLEAKIADGMDLGEDIVSWKSVLQDMY